MKIGILGSNGRMGQTLIDTVSKTAGVTLAGGADKGDNIEALIKKSDAVIDFTSPVASLAFAELTAKHGIAHVIGTTGFEEAQLSQLKTYAKNTRIFWSPNMSVGVNLVASLVEKAAKLLNEEYDIEVLEMHHKHKKDAPSGTALLLGEAAAAGRGVNLAKVSDRVRDGITGERKTGNIGFATLRGGSVIGDHTVMFAGEEDRIEITHKASSRSIFATGAVKAAIWVQAKPNGFYTMKEFLSSSEFASRPPKL